MTNFQEQPGTAQTDGLRKQALGLKKKLEGLEGKVRSFGTKIPPEDKEVLARNLGRLAEQLNPVSLLGAKAMFYEAKEEWTKRRRLILLASDKGSPKEPFESAYMKYLNLARAAGNIMARKDGPSSENRHLTNALETLLKGSSKLPSDSLQIANLDTGVDLLNKAFELLGERIADQKTGIVELWKHFQLNPFDKWHYTEAEAREALGHIPLFQKAWAWTDQLPADQRGELFATSSSSKWKIPTLPLGRVHKLMHARTFRIPAEIGTEYSKASDVNGQDQIVTDWLNSIEHDSECHFPMIEYVRARDYGWSLETIITILEFKLQIQIENGNVVFNILTDYIGNYIDYSDQEVNYLRQPMYYPSFLRFSDAQNFNFWYDDINLDADLIQNFEKIREQSCRKDFIFDNEFNYFLPLQWPSWIKEASWLDDNPFQPDQLIGYIDNISDFGTLLPLPNDEYEQFNTDVRFGYAEEPKTAFLESEEWSNIVTKNDHYLKNIEFYFNFNDDLENCLPIGSLGSALLKNLCGPEDDNRIDIVILKMCNLLSESGLKYHNEIIEEYRKNLGLKPTVEGA
jgi:hypothetical protein